MADDRCAGRASSRRGSRRRSDAPHAVALNSATAALHLSIEALGVGPGDLVFVPTYTFAASAEVVRYVGATPVLVDVDADTLNLDPDRLRARIRSPSTRAREGRPRSCRSTSRASPCDME